MKQTELMSSGTGACVLWAAGAVASFQLAYCVPGLGLVILAYPICVLQLARAPTTRQSFYFGLAVMLVNTVLQLSCFWTIFGWPAVVLWLILAFWTASFTALARESLVRFGTVWGALLLPFLWTGLEYFRSELYYLRFSWLNVGYALSDSAVLPLFRWLGIYGVGFVAMVLGVAVWFFRPRNVTLYAVLFGPVVALFVLVPTLGGFSSSSRDSGRSVRAAGVQLEFPITAEVVSELDNIIRKEPSAELLVLSEYTFDGEVPEKIKNWCRKHQRYLVVGGKDPAPKSNFYDTAFVIGPTGQVVFRQVKSVPIQFFKDGLPAVEQKLWESPWGKIGICVCYDLSYARVTDRLVRLGAKAIIVPTMDVADWGQRQHELHARVAPIRSAEYRLPIFRLASSGISQCTDRAGRVTSQAGFPGQNEIIAGTLLLADSGRLPFDRWLAPFASFLTGLVLVWLLVRRSPVRSRLDLREDATGNPKLP